MKNGIFLLLLVAAVIPAQAQMARQRAQVDGPVDATFKATKLIQLPTTKNFDANTLNFSIMHSFDKVSTGAQNLWGLDGGANIRFGLDYGISEKWSVGVGRSRLDKVFDFRTKYVILEQLRSGKIPITVAYQGNVGINTSKNAFISDYDLVHKLSFSHVLMVSRKFNESFSAQLSPTVVHFNRVPADDPSPASTGVQGGPNTLLALGVSGRYKLNKRTSVIGEFVPVLSEKPEGLKNGLSLGIELETGGHVFQMFVTSATGLNEQYAIGRNTDPFFGGDKFGNFRFGFNVHRIFWFGGQ